VTSATMRRCRPLLHSCLIIDPRKNGRLEEIRVNDISTLHPREELHRTYHRWLRFVRRERTTRWSRSTRQSRDIDNVEGYSSTGQPSSSTPKFSHVARHRDPDCSMSIISNELRICVSANIRNSVQGIRVLEIGPARLELLLRHRQTEHLPGDRASEDFFWASVIAVPDRCKSQQGRQYTGNSQQLGRIFRVGAWPICRARLQYDGRDSYDQREEIFVCNGAISEEGHRRKSGMRSALDPGDRSTQGT